MMSLTAAPASMCDHYARRPCNAEERGIIIVLLANGGKTTAFRLLPAP
ncbi:hypothetical protein KCP77_13755 [Salmonella enterica subsp. enterica]|nr:hypothetical protein KCP77_13755 [Salmonella enterica subsp. enterica]